MVQVTFDPRDGADCKVVRTLLKKTKRLQRDKTTPKIQVPEHGPKYTAQTIQIDGKPREVQPSICEVLREIANGATMVWMRPETVERLRALAPWLMAMLEREPNRRITRNRTPFKVDEQARLSCTVS